MINEDKFVELAKTVLNRNIEDNLDQKKAVLADVYDDQFIVAGPGSGKTTTLVLKILKYYFVDGINPENMMVTTFTKKAAGELEKRTINWAQKIADAIDEPLTNSFKKMKIGTLDSIAEDYVSKHDDVSVIDNFTTSALMMQTLLDGDRQEDKQLKQFIRDLNGGSAKLSVSEINKKLIDFRSAVYNDMADISKMYAEAGSEKIVFDILNEYEVKLKERDILDYSLLERRFFELLQEDAFDDLIDNLQVLLVDEYQDTNYLQEQIYFRIASYVKDNNGSITIVGDDDQSLYRFRGANVSLFINYVERISASVGIKPNIVYLHENYRSSANIVNFLNDYISVDEKYTQCRTSQKPDIVATKTAENGYPVVGIFINNMEELANDISHLIYSLKMNEEVEFKGINSSFNVKFNDPSIAYLLYSPQEINKGNNKKLPYYIRENLLKLDEDIMVFNPRGQNIEKTEIASLMCGLMLISIDKDKQLESSVSNIPKRTQKTLTQWREYATSYINEKEEELVVEIDEGNVYMPDLINIIKNESQFLIEQTAENKIYYDIICEAIEQTIDAIAYEGYISSKQLFHNILFPIALGVMEIDDESFGDINLDETVNIMSIHQAKGLEFDVVIVDVGSDIRKLDNYSEFKIFPKKPGDTYGIENYIRDDYSDLNVVDKDVAIDEAFNEIIRRFFVAYSRPKSLLILCGLNSMRMGIKGNFGRKYIPNMATGWNRDKVWKWENLDNLFNTIDKI